MHFKVSSARFKTKAAKYGESFLRRANELGKFSMSKSIMIVICDFLLLSLLSLANFEKPAEDPLKKPDEALIQQNFADSQMLDLLKMSLDNEREKRLALSSDLQKISQAAEANRVQAEEQKRVIAAREKELKSMAQTKLELEKERAKILEQSQALQVRVKASEERNAALQQEIISAAAKLDKSAQERLALEKELGNMREVDSTTKLKLMSVQEELKQNKEHLERLRAESESLKNENKAIEIEKQALSTKLEVATTKTKIYEENIKRYETLVDIEKTEKEKIREHAENLAAGVSELASSQKEITKEVRELRPQTSSEIFAKLKQKFISVKFEYTKRGLLGSSANVLEIRALPIVINDRTWLLFSAVDTILPPSIHRYFPPETLKVSVEGKTAKFSAPRIFAVMEDPKLLAIPLPKEFCDAEKMNPLEIASNTYAYPECVVVDPEKFYYGQVPFRADFRNDSYAQLDVGLFEPIFGTFAPSEGDFVISRNGEFLGIMSNGSVAYITRMMTPIKSLKLGTAFSPKSCAEFVGTTSARLKMMPLSLR